MESSTYKIGNTGRVNICFHITTSQQVMGSLGVSHEKKHFHFHFNSIFGPQVTPLDTTRKSTVHPTI